MGQSPLKHGKSGDRQTDTQTDGKLIYKVGYHSILKFWNRNTMASPVRKIERKL
jgi:hypothetical protein